MDYIFKPPGPRHIKLLPTVEEAFRLLKTYNRRLGEDHAVPDEILLAIAQESQSNSLKISVASKFVAVRDDVDKLLQWESLDGFRFRDRGLPLGRLSYDEAERKFFIRDPSRDEGRYLWEICSSADLLYRMRCVFPEMTILSAGPEGYKYVFVAGVIHVETGYGLAISEWKGAPLLRVLWHGRHEPPLTEADRERSSLFSEEVVQLLNLLLQTDAKGNLEYLHPASLSDIRGSNIPFLVTAPLGADRLEEWTEVESDSVRAVWTPGEQAGLEDAMSLQGIVRYDAQTREFFSPSSPPGKQGEAPSLTLGNVISPALLLYRLLCTFCFGYIPCKAGDPASVWELSLMTGNGGILVLKDDHGLVNVFCASASAANKAFMGHVKDLLAFLCSDHCPHPYDGVLAGSVG
jgi:hypothetical protein